MARILARISASMVRACCGLRVIAEPSPFGGSATGFQTSEAGRVRVVTLAVSSGCYAASRRRRPGGRHWPNHAVRSAFCAVVPGDQVVTARCSWYPWKLIRWRSSRTQHGLGGWLIDTAPEDHPPVQHDDHWHARSTLHHAVRSTIGRERQATLPRVLHVG